MASLNFGKKQKKKVIPETIEFSPSLHAKQREMWNDDHRFIVISAGRRFGKALALDTPILTSDFSWSTVGDLQIGDKIFDDSGNPVEITELHGIYHNRPCYRVHFDNGDSIVADAEHDWVVFVGTSSRTYREATKHTTRHLFQAISLGYTVKLPQYCLPIHAETNSIHRARKIISIIPIESVPVKCITVDNESHLFLAGRSLVPTHNSFFCAYKIIYEALRKKDSVNWVVAPTYSQTMLIWRKILMVCPEAAIESINRTDNTIYLVNGASIWAKSGNTPDNLRGEGIDFLVIEEAGFLKRDVWDVVLRPALADKKGKAIVISCVTKDTWVFTEDGMRQFSDLTSCEEPDTWIPYTKQVASMGNTVDTTSDIYVTGETDTWKITSCAGYPIEGTYNHPITVMGDDGNILLKPLSDIKVGDWVAINRGMNLWGDNDDISGFKYDGRCTLNSRSVQLDEMSDDLAYLMGYILGDGHVSYGKPYNITIACAPNEYDTHKFLSSFPIGMEFSTYPNGPYHWTTTNKKFTEFLNWYGFTGDIAKNKRIPKRLFSASKNTVCQFLSGLFDADGHSRKRYGEVGLSSTSKDLIFDVRMLLLNLGIICRLTEYDVKPTQKVKVWSHEYQLSITGSSAKLFYNLIGFRIQRKSINQMYLSTSQKSDNSNGIPLQGQRVERLRKGNWFDGNNSNKIAHIKKTKLCSYPKVREVLEICQDTAAQDDYNILQEYCELNYYWDQVKSIEEGKAVTYDFHIPESHLFVSNGYISHNTPKGKNLFYELFNLGLLKEEGGVETIDPEWKSFNCSSWNNPMLDRRELETLKRTLPPMTYAQEILAEFIDDAGSVFTGLDGIIRDGGFKDPIWDYIYVMGVDLAKYDDYTVIVVLDVVNRDVVYFKRFNNRDWVTQKQYILEVSEMFNKCPVVMDSTGVGDPIADDLYAAGVAVRPFKFSTATKPPLIRKLQFAIENQQFTMPRIDVLYRELQMFSYTLTPAGYTVYAAPNGHKDDCVMALALAVFHLDLIAPPAGSWEFY